MCRISFYWQYLAGDAKMAGVNAVHIITSKPRPPLDQEDMQGRFLSINHNDMAYNHANQTVFIARAYEPDKLELLDFLAFFTKDFSI